MGDDDLKGRMLAHRHLLVMLLSKQPDMVELDVLIQAADNLEGTDKAERGAAYRDEIDAITSGAVFMQRNI